MVAATRLDMRLGSNVLFILLEMSLFEHASVRYMVLPSPLLAMQAADISTLPVAVTNGSPAVGPFS